MRVRVTLTIEVDSEAWTEAYGIEGARAIADDVRQYVRNGVRDRLIDGDERLASEVYLAPTARTGGFALRQ